MIVIKPVPRNTHFSIRESFNPDSNLTEESDSHPEKHPSPKTSINAGRTVSSNPVLQTKLDRTDTSLQFHGYYSVSVD
jgi:hypothetical protein